DAGLPIADIRVVAPTADATVEHLEADDLPQHAVRLLLAQTRGADEVVLLPADDPAQIRLERRRRLVDVVAVEAHRRFEPQGVSRAEPARNDAGVAAGLEDRLPDAIGRLRRNKHLETVLARVAGPRDCRADVRHLAMAEPVVLHRRELDA